MTSLERIEPPLPSSTTVATIAAPLTIDTSKMVRVHVEVPLTGGGEIPPVRVEIGERPSILDRLAAGIEKFYTDLWNR